MSDSLLHGLTQLAQQAEFWGALIWAFIIWWIRGRLQGDSLPVRVVRRLLLASAALFILYALILAVSTLFGLNVSIALAAGGRLLLILILAYGGWVLSDAAGGYLVKRLPSMDEFQVRRLQTTRDIIRWIGRILVVFIAGTMILDVFNVNIAPLLAGAGVAGLAIGMGSQKLMQDIIAGIFILIEDQFHVGDSVEVAGVAGTVESMSLRVTQVRDFHGVLHFIPNSEIGHVANRTRAWARAIADVGVAYDSDLDKVEEVLTQVGERLYKENPDAIFLEPPFPLGPEELGDSAIAFRLVAKVRPGKQWDAQRIMRRRIKEALDEAGIVIPFPQVDVHFYREDV